MPSRLLRQIITFIVLSFSLTFNLSQINAQDNENITTLAWSPDGNIIASGTNLGIISLWDTTTGELFNKFQAHTGGITSISWSPDSQNFATASSDDNAYRIRERETGTLSIELMPDTYNEGRVFVEWNPRENILISVAGVYDGTSPLHLWRIDESGAYLLPARLNVAANDIAWSPTGMQLAIAQFPGIFIISDFSSSTIERHWIAPMHTLIAWSPDEAKIATLDVINDVIDIVNVNTGEILLQVQRGEHSLENSISTIIWSPDDSSGIIQSWDANTGQLIETQTFDDREGGRFLISLSPYGGRLAVGNSTPMTQAISGIDQHMQTLADGEIQIIVPAPSIERIQDIANLCGATLDAQTDLLALVASQVERLDIPPACRADLIAVANALQE